MKRGGVSSMYEDLELTEAYELFLTSVGRGDMTAARHVVDAMPTEYYSVRSSHLSNLDAGFWAVVWAVERELLPATATLGLLGALCACADAHASVTRDRLTHVSVRHSCGR